VLVVARDVRVQIEPEAFNAVFVRAVRRQEVELNSRHLPTRSFIDAVPPTAAGASSRGPDIRPTAPVRRHGCQLDPRLELDSSWWPRPSEARGTWRRSRSGGPTERCGSGAFAGRSDVCLASERSIEWRASGISETSNPRPKAFSASRSDLVLRAQMSLFSVGECRWTTTPGLESGRMKRKGHTKLMSMSCRPLLRAHSLAAVNY
jgi:hypothetical protein